MKKNNLVVCVAIISATLLHSCANGTKDAKDTNSKNDSTKIETAKAESSKDVAQLFLTAVTHVDLETAKAYSTDSTRASFEKISVMLNALTPDERKEFDEKKKASEKLTITIKDVKEIADKAIISFTTSESPEKVNTLNMVKINGKWLADFDIMKM